MNNFLLPFIIIFVLLWKKAQGLSKVHIGMKPYQYEYVEPYALPMVASETPAPDFQLQNVAENVEPLNYDPDENGVPLKSGLKMKSITNTAEILAQPSPKKTKLPSKRKMKKKKRKTKLKKKPKKMNLRRVFKTRLITTTPVPSPKIVTDQHIDDVTNKIINLAPIYDNESGISYKQEDLAKICLETVQMSKNFGITNIDEFAKNNCFLIRLYYPNVTCSQINQLVEYCSTNGLM